MASNAVLRKNPRKNRRLWSKKCSLWQAAMEKSASGDMSLNDWLVIAITLAAAIRRDTLMFCIMVATVAHTATDYAINMSGYSYYITAALIDSVAVFSIACMSPVSRSVKAVQALCASFIAAHIFGLAWWFAYEPPLIYNTVCSLIYAAMLAITLFKGGKKRVGADKSGQRTFLSRIAVHTSSKVVREHEGFTR